MPPPLRIFHLEDNPLSVLHVERLIDDPEQVCSGAPSGFADLQKQFAETAMDGALVDIGISEGSTGPLVAAWLPARGIMSACAGVDVY